MQLVLCPKVAHSWDICERYKPENNSTHVYRRAVNNLLFFAHARKKLISSTPADHETNIQLFSAKFTNKISWKSKNWNTGNIR